MSDGECCYMGLPVGGTGGGGTEGTSISLRDTDALIMQSHTVYVILHTQHPF